MTRSHDREQTVHALKRALDESRAEIDDHPDPTEAQLVALARDELAPPAASQLRRLLALRPAQFLRYLDVRLSLGLPLVAGAVRAGYAPRQDAPASDWASLALVLDTVDPRHAATARAAMRPNEVVAIGRAAKWEVVLTQELGMLFLRLLHAGTPAPRVQAILLLYDASGRERLERDGITNESGVAALGAWPRRELIPHGGQVLVTLRWRQE